GWGAPGSGSPSALGWRRARRPGPRSSAASATSTPAPQAPPAEIPAEAAAHWCPSVASGWGLVAGGRGLVAGGRGPADEGPADEGPATRSPRTRGLRTRGPVVEGPAAEGPVVEGPLRGTAAGPAHPDAGCWLLGEERP